MAKKSLIPVFIALAFVMCKHADSYKNIAEESDSLSVTSTRQSSLCSDHFADLKEKNCHLLRFCDIILNDSAAREFLRKRSQDKSSYNFNYSKIQIFNQAHDTLRFTDYFLGSPSIILFPETIYLVKDTLHFALGSNNDISACRCDPIHMLEFELLVQKGTTVSAINMDGE